MSKPTDDKRLAEIRSRLTDGFMEGSVGSSRKALGDFIDMLRDDASFLLSKIAEYEARDGAVKFGPGDYSCATCGMGMVEPCEHWKEMIAAKAEPEGAREKLGAALHDVHVEGRRRPLTAEERNDIMEVVLPVVSAIAIKARREALQAAEDLFTHGDILEEPKDYYDAIHQLGSTAPTLAPAAPPPQVREAESVERMDCGHLRVELAGYGHPGDGEACLACDRERTAREEGVKAGLKAAADKVQARYENSCDCRAQYCVHSLYRSADAEAILALPVTEIASGGK